MACFHFPQEGGDGTMALIRKAGSLPDLTGLSEKKPC